MTEREWLDTATAHRAALAALLRAYHPANISARNPPMKITAVAAERACENVREDIRRNHEGDPVAQFDEAIKGGDVNTAMRLLDQAWFGVPESTSCWNIEGFKEAVDLLDDPPEG